MANLLGRNTTDAKRHGKLLLGTWGHARDYKGSRLPDSCGNLGKLRDARSGQPLSDATCRKTRVGKAECVFEIHLLGKSRGKLRDARSGQPLSDATCRKTRVGKAECVFENHLLGKSRGKLRAARSGQPLSDAKL